MKTTAAELACIRLTGLYVAEKCDACRRVLNQAFRYTIAGRPEIYCSGLCRDAAFFGNRREAEQLARPGKCAHCGGSLSGKRGALYCDDACRKAHSRKRQASRDGATRKIADTGLIQSITCKDANRQLRQSLVPTVSAALRGTERDSTTGKVSESGLKPVSKSENGTGRLLPKWLQGF